MLRETQAIVQRWQFAQMAVQRGSEQRALMLDFGYSPEALLNNVDITHVLRPFPLSQFTVHQRKDGSVIVRIRDHDAEVGRIRPALQELFGVEVPLDIVTGAAFDGKVMQYTVEG